MSDDDEIKLGKLNFDGNEDSFFQKSNYTNTDSFSNTQINSSLDEMGYSQYTGDNGEHQKNQENNFVHISMEKPDDAKVKRFTLWAAIIFFLIVIPIVYHPLYEMYQSYNMTYEVKDLEVEVTNFKKHDIYNKTDATGLITPESSVDVVARVDGYLQHTYFKEGDFIKQGQLLFKIEPNEYEIAVRAARASVEQTKAVYDNSLQELERAKELIKENFISRSDYDAIVATANRDKAALDEVKQSLARAQLNLDYTNIYAPLSGKAGKIQLSDGNYVGLSSGPLVNIAKTNPICVSFSMKSSDVIKLKQSNNGEFNLSTAKVEITLSDDSKYDQIGKINFSDNMVAEDAATLSLKAVFNNKDNILVPGDYVKVTITPEQPVSRYLIPHSITHGDALNGYYLWAYQAGKIKKMPIEVLGSKDNFWIVDSGISDKDAIVVESNQNISYEGINAKLKGVKKEMNQEK